MLYTTYMHPLQAQYAPYREGMGTLNRFGKRLEKLRGTLALYGITKLAPYWPETPDNDPRKTWHTFILALETQAKDLEGSKNGKLLI